MLYSPKDDMGLDDLDSDIAMFFSTGLALSIIDLDNVNLDLMQMTLLILFLLKLFLIVINLKNINHIKKIDKVLILIAQHPTILRDWCISKIKFCELISVMHKKILVFGRFQRLLQFKKKIYKTMVSRYFLVFYRFKFVHQRVSSSDTFYWFFVV